MVEIYFRLQNFLHEVLNIVYFVLLSFHMMYTGLKCFNHHGLLAWKDRGHIHEEAPFI